MKCPKCHSDNPDTKSFCADCGTQLGSPKDIPEVTKTIETPFPQFSKGTSLVGRYEIITELGKGGMGEVYLAEDTSLKRQVAIKVLPQQFALDKERLARFEREARLLASLNHPNIATIHGLEKSDGQQFLIMEFLEGETLAERIKKGPLPVDEALELCIQIAEGLESAHEKGIIHRDLKPSNVNITPEGKVKILDFGLAKAFLDQSDVSDLSKSPTITDEMTRPGVILGTAAYMSPEQAKGKTVDKRTDIWAFGVILYECLTGKSLFKGGLISEILASILKDEPDWAVLPSDLPPAVPLLLERCLQKDQKRRLRDIGDARLELEEADRRPAESASYSPESSAKNLRALLGGSLMALAVALVAAVWGWTRGSFQELAESKVTRWEVALEEPLRLAVGGRTNPLTISSDGSRIVFAAERRGTSHLYLREFDDFDFKLIPGTEGARNPFFSADGKRVGFFAGTKMQTVAFDGGPPRVILESALDDMGSSWGGDETIVFASYGAGLSRVPANGGHSEVLTTLNYEAGEIQHRWPQIMPDGRSVMFTVATDKGSRIGLVSLETRERQTLSEIADLTRARYVSSGHLVFGHARGLSAIRFDPVSGSTSGEAISVLSDVASIPDLGNSFFAISDTGTIVFVPGVTSGDLELVWVDRQGQVTPAVEGKASFMHPRLSPDNQHIAVSGGAEIGLRKIWLYDLERKTREILGGDGSHSTPRWTPEGKELVFSSNVNGSWDLYIAATQGTTGPKEFVVRKYEQWGGSWSPDGQSFFFYDVHPETGRDIWSFDVEAQESRPYLVTPNNERAPRISPDGRWLAYISNETGLDEVYVESLPERGRKWTISTDGGTEPVWSGDGRELFYRQGDLMMVVDVVLGTEFSAGKPRLLFEGRFDVGVIGNPDYDVTADGKRFLMLKRSEATAPVKLHVILNWAQALADSFASQE
jgi:serine/threonine protein kinase/Tol biopolymer transport system component